MLINIFIPSPFPPIPVSVEGKTLDMLGLAVFPEASLVLRHPEAVFTLPKATLLDLSL